MKHTLSYCTVVLSLFLSIAAIAESGCYPERELLGTPANGWIPIANHYLVDNSGKIDGEDRQGFVVDWVNGVCQAKHFDLNTRQVLGVVDCSSLLCVKAECGDKDGEYASLALLQSSGDFVQVLRKTDSPVWLKWRNKYKDLGRDHGPQPLWDNNELGLLHSNYEQMPIYKYLGDGPIDYDLSNPTHAYKVINSLEYEGSTYLELQSVVLLEDDDSYTMNLGAEEGVVYLKHRDPEGNLVAVLSSYYCD